MKAIVISAHGGPEVLTLTELPDPVPADGEVLIRVKAFGLNHAEAYMRSGAWGRSQPSPASSAPGWSRPTRPANSPSEPGSWRYSAAWGGPATEATRSW